MAEAKKTPAKKTSTAKKAAPKAQAKVEDVVAKAEDVRLVDVARSAAETYVGFGVLAAETIKAQADAGVELLEKMFEDARGKGEAQIAEFRTSVDPLADRMKKQMEPLTSRFEDMDLPKIDLNEIKVPAQIVDAVEKGNERLRALASR